MRAAGALFLASLMFLLVGCSGVAFDSNQRAFQDAASRVSQSDATDSYRAVELTGSDRKLAVGGVAYLYERAGAKYVFFPQQVEEPNFYTGYLFIDGSGEPGAVLESFTEIGSGWWKGELSQEVLAGG